MFAYTTEHLRMPLSSPRIRESPRDVKPEGFPMSAPRHGQLKYALQYAVLAPSTHNSQPWLFRVTDESVFLFADRSRGLPAMDPEDRCMLMSCGAALQNLTLALDALGFGYRVSRFPDLSDPDLLARVDVKARSRRDIDTPALENIIARRSVAHQHAVLPPPVEAIENVRHAMEKGGASMIFIRPDEMDIVVQIVEEHADDAPVLAKEEAVWRHPNRARSRDGIPGAAQQHASSIFNEPEGAVFALLATHGDRMSSWMRGGAALERGLLAATRERLAVSLSSTPLHLSHVRKKLGAALTLTGTPQLFLRLAGSSGPAVPPTPRRPLVDVMIHPGFSG